jgi:Uma2 family endonuclease
MSAEIIKKRFTVDEYYRMVEVGILQPKERVELIDGEIVEMSPISHRHGVRVIRLTTLFVKAFDERGIVSVQGSIRLKDWTEPQPDFVVFKPRPDFYAGKKTAPQDVLFLMEVSDASLRYDRNVKVPLYAAAGIPEVWVEDAKNDILYVYRDPRDGSYSVMIEAKRGDFISPLAFPDIQFPIDHLLGEPIDE